ncbi:MAG: DUF1360 domain-containing protein [Verrucomicrobia bacterium]|nr:DUF1360 domain-containing protein [Verrucomicrobiota bacterium]
MKEPLVFIITALAVYRATRFVIQDELVSPLRNRLWKKFPPETNKFGYLFTCMWCMSIWTASLFVLSSIIMPTITFYVCLVLALSAIVGLLTAYENRD